MPATSANRSRARPANRESTVTPPPKDEHARRCHVIYDEIVKDLTLVTKKKKDRLLNAEYRGKHLERFEAFGRLIPRTVDAFVPMGHAIETGLTANGVWNPSGSNLASTDADTNSDWDSDDESAPQGPERLDRNRLNRYVYSQLTTLIPHFEGVLSLLAQDVDDVKRFAEALNDAVLQVKGDDRKKMKMAILDIISLCGYEVGDPRPINKSDRGLTSRVTGPLICPARYLEQLRNERESFLAQAADGSIRITAFNMPAFCYRKNFRYNPEDPDVGLFKSEFLLRVFRHLFMGTGISEAKSRQSARATVADINKLTTITGRMIAYTAVQARFALSSADEYSTTDIHFNYEEFYYAIVSWFEEDAEDDAAVCDTLEWWAKKIWPNGPTVKTSKKRLVPACDNGPESDIARSRAARRQCRTGGQLQRQSSRNEA